MWTTFKDVGHAFFSNIDDFAMVIFIIIVGNKFANLLYIFLKTFMGTQPLTAQTVKISLQLFIFTTCIIQLLGSAILNSASAGIAIGVGYAFQPYIISIFNGLMIHNDNIIVANKTFISIPGLHIKQVKVTEIGLFHTELENNDNEKILLSNSMLSTSAIIVHNNIKRLETKELDANSVANSVTPHNINDHNALHYLHAVS